MRKTLLLILAGTAAASSGEDPWAQGNDPWSQNPTRSTNPVSPKAKAPPQPVRAKAPPPAVPMSRTKAPPSTRLINRAIEQSQVPSKAPMPVPKSEALPLDQENSAGMASTAFTTQSSKNKIRPTPGLSLPFRSPPGLPHPTEVQARTAMPEQSSPLHQIPRLDLSYSQGTESTTVVSSSNTSNGSGDSDRRPQIQRPRRGLPGDSLYVKFHRMASPQERNAAEKELCKIAQELGGQFTKNGGGSCATMQFPGNPGAKNAMQNKFAENPILGVYKLEDVREKRRR